MSQQQHQPYPYTQGEWMEATSVHPAIEQHTDHYAAQQVAPRFYPVPRPPHYDPGWSDGPTPKKRQKLLTNAWFWVALIELVVICSIGALLVLS